MNSVLRKDLERDLTAALQQTFHLYQVETQPKLSADHPAHFNPAIIRVVLRRDPISHPQACEPFHGNLAPDVQLQLFPVVCKGWGLSCDITQHP